VFKDGEVEKALGTSSALKIKNDKNGQISFDIKNNKDALAVKPMVYTKDTLFLETDLVIKEQAKKYLDINQSEEVLVVKTLAGAYIGNTVTDFKLHSERLIKPDNNLSESLQTTALKAYETPSNIFQIYFSVLQKESVSTHLSELSNSILEELKAREELQEHPLIHKKNFKKELLMLISKVLEAEFYKSVQIQLEEESPSSNIRQMQDLTKKYAPQLIQKAIDANNSLFPFKEILNEKIRIPILDMQAGSGEGIFTGGKQSGFGINLIGTELRKPEEMNKPEFTDSEDYNVITGINATTHMGDYESLFNNKTLKTATLNTIVYQNPPFTKNNELAKDSVLILKQDQNIFGIYPTSMESFLKDNINGFIFTIPKKLSGYTDSNVPENLLFVIGSRHDEDYVSELMQTRSAQGLTLMSNVDTRAKNLSVSITDTSIESAAKVILRNLRLNSNIYNLKERAKPMFRYNADKGGDSVLVSNLSHYIEGTSDMINSMKEVNDAVEGQIDKIMSKFNSNDAFKKEKIFPDYRKYNPTRKYEKLTYNEVLLQRSLLVFYRDKYPEIFKIIKSLAIEDEVELGLDETNAVNYSLSEPIKPLKKDVVSTESLGLMKLAYYPTSFALSTKEDKDALKKVVIDVFNSGGIKEKDISQNTIDAINMLIEDSNRLVIKSEDKISSELDINKEEVFVLIDEDGLDIAKLNISLTDFYNSLERLNMFDINNYVESAILSDEKKEVMITNFMEHAKNLVDTIELKNKDREAGYLESSALQTLLKLKSIKDSKGLEEDKTNAELYLFLEFSKANGILEYYKSFVTQTEPEKILNKLFFDNVSFVGINEKEIKDGLLKITTLFSEMPISFFERERENSENLIRSVYRDLSNSSSFSEESLKEAENNFVIDVYEQLSAEYDIRKSVAEASIKTAKMLVVNFSLMKMQMKKGIDKVKLYDVFFENMMLNTFGLMPHQFKNAERFIEISDDKSVDILNWEMRSGKTLTFLTELWLLMLYKQTDANLLLETKTFNDIASQTMQHLPIIMPNMKFNLPKSGVNQTILNPDNVYEFVGENNDIFPNIPKILNPYFINKGKGQLEELERFGFEFEDLLAKVKEKGLTLEDMKERYPDATFSYLLDNACG